MNFENEIVMIGGISQTTGEVFGRLKVKNLNFPNHFDQAKAFLVGGKVTSRRDNRKFLMDRLSSATLFSR